MRRLNSAFLLHLCLFTAPLFAGEVQPVDHLIDLLDDIETLHGKFEQVGQGEPQHGVLWLAKPNQFRVESSPPLSQTIVSNGEDLWTHDRDLHQVIISELDTQAGEIPLLLFAGEAARLRESYIVEQFTDDQHQYFVLTPVAENRVFAGFTLAFLDSLPVRLSFETTMNETTVINFYDMTVDVEDHAIFRMAVPDHVDVIDDRLVSD